MEMINIQIFYYIMTKKDVRILERDFINYFKNIKMIFIRQYIIVIKYYGVDKYIFILYFKYYFFIKNND